MKGKLLALGVSLLFLTGVALAATGYLEVFTYFIGNISVPSRADAENVNLNERFEWFQVEVEHPVPLNFTWVNGTNLENVNAYVETPSGDSIKLHLDPMDRLNIESAEVGNYTVYARAERVGEVKGFLRVSCKYCRIENLGKWRWEE